MAENKFEYISLTLVGCGAMGAALLKGWLESDDLIDTVTVVTPEKETVDPFLAKYSNVKYVAGAKDLGATGDVLVFAVKPQILPKIIDQYIGLITKDTLVVSIAAGLDLNFYETSLGADKQIVRVMPNTPSTIGKAMSGLLANKMVNSQKKQLATVIMQSVGKVVWVENDDEIDRLTAISGCGPAYLFLLVEALTKAATELGFSAENAELLARETIIGSSEYLATAKNNTAKDLRIQVASPGGMTEQAILRFKESDSLDNLVLEAVNAAYNRAAVLKK